MSMQSVLTDWGGQRVMGVLLALVALVGLGAVSAARADTFPGGFLESDDTSVARPNLTAAQIALFMPSRGLFTFPAPYNTQGIRITNASDCGGGDCLDLIYSYWRNLSNSTGSNTMYIFVGLNRARGGAGPTLFSYDKTTDQLTDLGPMFPSSSPYSWMSTEGWYFSYSLPDDIYITTGSQLQRYNVLTHTFQTVFDTTTQYPNTVLWQTSASANDEVFAGTLEDASTYAMLGCVVYNASTQKFALFSQGFIAFNECHVDMSGRYVFIDTKTATTCSRCDLDTVVEDLQTGAQYIIPNQDGGGGHYAMGYDSWVNANNWTVANAWGFWDASQPYVENGPLNLTSATDPLSGLLQGSAGPLIQGGLVHQDEDYNVFEPSHIAWAAQPNVPIAQQYACGGANPTTIVAPHSQEITCFLLDDSIAPANQQVLVVAPTMTNPNASGGSFCSGCVNYAQDPKGNIDPTGHYFFFVSNLDSNRMDAIIVKIPSQLLTGSTASDPAPTDSPPSVSITSPAAGASVSGTVPVTASATDSSGIANVQFLLDGSDLGSAVTQAPYSVSWNTGNVATGSHTLTAVATDTSGLSTTSSPVTVTVQTGAPNISAVTAGAVTSSGATITWTTNQPSNSQVVYGTTTAYGSSSALNTTLVTAHSVVLTGLAAGTTYHYAVKSANSAGVLATSSDATFATGTGSSGGLPNPIGYWKLNEGGGSTAVDSSGNGHNGSILGLPSWGTGLEGTDLLLDGSDDFVDVPSTGSLNIFPLSISFWINTGDTTGLHGLINKYYPSSMNGYQVFLNNGNLCAWYFRDSSDYVWDGSSCTLSTAGVANNQWHHVVFVVDRNGGRLYVDGAQTASRAWTGSYGVTSTNQDLEFGQYPGTATPFVSGALFDVRLFGAALTAQQVAKLYNAVPRVQNVVWTNVVNATVTGNSLQKSGGCDGCQDAGAVSQQQISGNGYLQFTASETNTNRAAGLAPLGAAETLASMPFAIHLQAGDAEVREYGVYQADVPFVSGDVFRIAVQAGVVSYYKNGTLFYTSTQTPSFPLEADVVLLNLGSTISNAVISAGP